MGTNRELLGGTMTPCGTPMYDSLLRGITFGGNTCIIVHQQMKQRMIASGASDIIMMGKESQAVMAISQQRNEEDDIEGIRLHQHKGACTNPHIPAIGDDAFGFSRRRSSYFCLSGSRPLAYDNRSE